MFLTIIRGDNSSQLARGVGYDYMVQPHMKLRGVPSCIENITAHIQYAYAILLYTVCLLAGVRYSTYNEYKNASMLMGQVSTSVQALLSLLGGVCNHVYTRLGASPTHLCVGVCTHT
jgi:hypothetical protein